MCEYGAIGGSGFGKPSRHNSRFIHCTGVIGEDCTQYCPCKTGIQQYVCMVGTKKRDEVHKNLYLQVLFHFFSHLKEEQMGPLNPW
jgi:hypothetical protein